MIRKEITCAISGRAGGVLRKEVNQFSRSEERHLLWQARCRREPPSWEGPCSGWPRLLPPAGAAGSGQGSLELGFSSNMTLPPSAS